MVQSILFENDEHTLVVVDLPRSIEEAQYVDGEETTSRRLLSTPAPLEPFPEPAGAGGISNAAQLAGAGPAALLGELTTRAAVESAMSELNGAGFDGPWCLPRHGNKRGGGEGAAKPPPGQKNDDALYTTPPGAHYLAGTIAACRDEFLAEAPQFDLIVLDPPWPNRSARRRRQGRKRKTTNAHEDRPYGGNGDDAGYETAYDMEKLGALLEQVPVGVKLARASASGAGGLVAVWVTNKPACEALLTDPKRGVFRAWGVELVATWTWLKVTARGEPVVSLDSQWRKPWERLLLARRPSMQMGGAGLLRPLPLPAQRIIVGVPDVHSRKPNLRPLLAPFLSLLVPSSSSSSKEPSRSIAGLEVFARNLTAGWWAWGSEVLLFQHRAWWTIDDEAAADGTGQTESGAATENT